MDDPDLTRAGGRAHGQRRMLAQEHGRVGPSSPAARGATRARPTSGRRFSPGEQFLRPPALARRHRERERLARPPSPLHPPWTVCASARAAVA
ncbi:MAG: hypothetical protein MZW92_53680 [Comamonadaceae bacterium]|nr:hypothetical protein [Comamonadaceae bacterium]